MKVPILQLKIKLARFLATSLPLDALFHITLGQFDPIWHWTSWQLRRAETRPHEAGGNDRVNLEIWPDLHPAKAWRRAEVRVGKTVGWWTFHCCTPGINLTTCLIGNGHCRRVRHDFHNSNHNQSASSWFQTGYAYAYASSMSFERGWRACAFKELEGGSWL